MWTGHPILSVGVGLVVAALTIQESLTAKREERTTDVIGGIGLGMALGYLWVLGVLFILAVAYAQEGEDKPDIKAKSKPNDPKRTTALPLADMEHRTLTNSVAVGNVVALLPDFLVPSDRRELTFNPNSSLGLKIEYEYVVNRVYDVEGTTMIMVDGHDVGLDARRFFYVRWNLKTMRV